MLPTLFVDRSAANADLSAMTNRVFFRGLTPAAVILSACVAFLFGCPRKDDSSSKSSASTSASATTTSAANTLTLEIVFSSEKKDWADDAIKDFNAQSQKTSDGRVISVHATYGGSVEPIAGIVAGTSKPHVFSPAS